MDTTQLYKRINHDVKNLQSSHLTTQISNYENKVNKIKEMIVIQEKPTELKLLIEQNYESIFMPEDISKYNEKQLEMLKNKVINNIMKNPKNTLELTLKQFKTKLENLNNDNSILNHLQNFCRVIWHSSNAKLFLIKLFNLDNYYDKIESEGMTIFPLNISSDPIVSNKEEQCLTKEQWKEMWKDIVIPAYIYLSDKYPFYPPKIFVFGTNPRYKTESLCINGISNYHSESYQSSEEILTIIQKFIDYTILLKMPYNKHTEHYGIGEIHITNIPTLLKSYRNKITTYKDINVDNEIIIPVQVYTSMFNKSNDGLFIPTD